MFCYLRVSISYVWINPFSPQISFFFNTNDNNWAIKMRISLISIFISYDDILLLNTKSIAKLQIIFILFLYINWIKVFKQFSNECSKISKKRKQQIFCKPIFSQSQVTDRIHYLGRSFLNCQPDAHHSGDETQNWQTKLCIYESTNMTNFFKFWW